MGSTLFHELALLPDAPWYNFRMGTKLSSHVIDLSDEQRRMLESLIGQPLQNDQVVHWAITTAGRQPTAADKERAIAGLKDIFSKVDRHLAEKHIDQAEWEAAVDEAVQSVRSRFDE
jgi:hypothetical protein